MTELKQICYILSFLLISCFLVGCRQEKAPDSTVRQKTIVDRTPVLKKKVAEARQFIKENKYDDNYCILIDMALPINKKRLFVCNPKKDSILYKALVCHGSGKESTMEKPVFSNEIGSNCTSLGKYRMGKRAYSNWGIHIHYKMHGLDSTNNNAYKRIIVLHSYQHSPCDENDPPVMASQGCPVVCNETMIYLDSLFQRSTKPVLMWIYN